ncbi:MAG: D-Ala-D-Ala carboxypeptidase family metallohydrolase [Paludibacter sp.]|nr:D-Ala-D-Ala carboxypeptidase family metallohydrolase [Paludibacter sp.]
MKFSKDFSLAELTATNSPFLNIPTENDIERLSELTYHVLQPLRNLFGKEIKIKSGFRSEEVNKHNRGDLNSQHCTGEAVDLTSIDNAQLFHLIRQHLPFDQLIWQGGDDLRPAWVHVSFSSNTPNRKQVLRMKTHKRKKVYERI